MPPASRAPPSLALVTGGLPEPDRVSDFVKSRVGRQVEDADSHRLTPSIPMTSCPPKNIRARK